MGKEIVIGLSAVFLLWVGTIFLFSTALVTRNWWMFQHWREMNRSRRVKMSLWLGVPLLMAGLLWMRGVAVYNYVAVTGCCPTATIVQMLVYMPMILTALALILYWVCDLSFNRAATEGNTEPRLAEEGPGVALADRVWRGLMVAGFVIGCASYFASKMLH